MDAVTRTPVAVNEPVRTYAPGSAERVSLEARVAELAGQRIDLPSTVGGVQVMGSGEVLDLVQPHARHHVLGTMRGTTHDDADAEGEIVLALGRLPEAAAGDERALADVSLVEHELMWFATQEIPDLLG